jgi:PAS domain S-box-containing protein
MDSPREEVAAGRPDRHLRVLVLEDLDADAELMTSALERAGAAFTVRHVKTRDEFVAALTGFAPDVILADYTLPGFGGEQALEIATVRSPDVPVIVVSGSLLDDAALELIRLGAVDYVFKNNLARLPSSVRRAVADAEQVGQRERAQVELRESEARQRHLLDNLNAGVVVHGPDTSILQSNVRAADLLGLTPDQMQGKVVADPGWRFVHEDGTTMPVEQFPVARVRATGAPVVDLLVGIDRPRTRDRVWVLVNAYPEHDDARRLRQVVVTFVEVTRRVEAERALRLQQERLDLAARSGQMGLWDLDLTTSTAWRTLQHDRLFGYEELQASWGPEDALRHVVPEDRLILQSAFDEALITGRFHYELRIDPVNQPQRWIEAKGEVIRDGSGKPIRMMGIVADVTGRKRAEQALRESERWLLLSQAIARIGHYVFDVAGDRWTSSDTLNALFGIDATDPRGAADWLRLVHPDDRASMEAYLADLLAKGTRFDREYRVVNQRNGDVLWVQGLGELQRSTGGQPVRLVGTIQDVTRAKMAEAERNTAQGQLALAARLTAMGTLVTGIAHEINNPLAATLADEEMALAAVDEIRNLLRGDLPLDREAVAARLAEASEELADAQAGGRRIAQIVKDLAAFGRPDLKRTRVRLIDVVEQAMRWLPASVGRAATIQVQNGGAPDVLASFGQLEQVVVNLVTNAAKASRPGRPNQVILRVLPGSPGMGRLEVIDEGTGIDPAIRERIFEPFFTNNVVGKGAGLGLSICKAIVGAHGGALTVESELGKGSTFRMEIPAAPAEA